MKLDTRTLRRLRILLGALLIAAMLSACSDSQETVPGDEDGSWEEYVAWWMLGDRRGESGRGRRFFAVQNRANGQSVSPAICNAGRI